MPEDIKEKKASMKTCYKSVHNNKLKETLSRFYLKLAENYLESI